MMKKTWQRAFPKHLFVISLFALMTNANALEPGPGAEPAYVDAQVQLRFPSKLSQMRYHRIMEFANKKLGYCVDYRGETDLGQLCVYDLGYENLPAGIDSTEFKEALAIAVNGTLEARNTAPFRNAQLIATGTPSIKSGDKEARAEMRMFTAELDELPGQPASKSITLILMTTGLGKFLKLNYSARDLSPDAFAEETDKIIREFVEFNGATMKKLMVDVKK